VKRTRGFTLLEMLVASTIMGIAIVGLMTGLSGAMRNASRLRDYDRVVQLARLRMNDILADPRKPLNGQLGGQFPPELVGGLNAGWQANVSMVEKGPTPTVNDFVLQRVQLQVWWMAADQRRTFSMDGYCSRPIVPGDLGGLQ
jgi:prepilin-type N-terminal cleavage/methylation domain-containing protein